MVKDILIKDSRVYSSRSIMISSRDKIKEFGQVRTPKGVARFLVRWSIRSPDDIVLDPGCGDGVFLLEAATYLLELGMRVEDIPKHLIGIEIDRGAIEELKRKFLRLFGVVPTIIPRSFFSVSSPSFIFSDLPYVDVVIGNPPYIRYQLFRHEEREKALKIALSAGVKLSELSASWVPFIIHAESFLKPSGRMAIVLPTRLLHVKYAMPFRKWLLNRFNKILIIVFEERVFRNVLEDTLLLLADKKGRKGLAILKLRNEESLRDLSLRGEELLFIEPRPEDKWTRYIVPPSCTKELLSVLKRVRGKVCELGDLAYVTIGAVTGCNEFFLLSLREVNSWNIERDFLVPAISRAEDIKGILFKEEDWRMMCRLGKKCFLLKVDLPLEEISKYNVSKYLRYGVEHLKLLSRYKVRIRKLWYSIPYVRVPDAFFTYMSHEVPRLALNLANVTSTNTIHQIFFKEGVDREIIAVSFYNSLTLLSAELSGRYYGGGVLKLEPKELERVLVIYSHSKVESLKRELMDMDRLIRRGRYYDVIETLDDILLKDYLGLSPKEINAIREYYMELRRNRLKKS